MTKFGDDLVQSLGEALAHAKGEDVPGMKINEGRNMTQHTHQGPNWRLIGAVVFSAAFWIAVAWWIV